MHVYVRKYSGGYANFIYKPISRASQDLVACQSSCNEQLQCVNKDIAKRDLEIQALQDTIAVLKADLHNKEKELSRWVQSSALHTIIHRWME